MSKKIKQFLIDHLGFQPLIWFLLLTSVGVVLTVDLELFRIMEPFKGGHKFQNIFYQLSLGFVVSFWFYYFLVFREEVKERKVIEPFLTHELRHCFREVYGIVQAMDANRNGGQPKRIKYPTKEEVLNLCAISDQNDNAHIYFAYNAHRPATLLERLHELHSYFEVMVPKVFLRMRLPDPEMKRYLTEIEQSMLFYKLRFSKQSSVSMTNIIPASAESIWAFMELCRQFSEYSNQRYSTPLFIDFFEKADSL